MDSTQFCGQVCHKVMEPEFTAYRTAPHARVTCVQCHIGPGAPGSSSRSCRASRQVFAVTLRTPTRARSPRRCTTCGRRATPASSATGREKFHGDKVRCGRSTPTTRRTPRRHDAAGACGRRQRRAGARAGHPLAHEVAQRGRVHRDRRQAPGDSVGARQGPTGRARVRRRGRRRRSSSRRASGGTMDCMDCHNRPSHTFAASAERAVDRAHRRGRDSADAAVRQAGGGRSARGGVPEPAGGGRRRSPRGCASSTGRTTSRVYMARRAGTSRRAVHGDAAIYARNVFPSMKVGWGTYPNNIGHMDFPGLLPLPRRQPQDERTARRSRQDCESCHAIE